MRPPLVLEPLLAVARDVTVDAGSRVDSLPAVVAARESGDLVVDAYVTDAFDLDDGTRRLTMRVVLQPRSHMTREGIEDAVRAAREAAQETLDASLR